MEVDYSSVLIVVRGLIARPQPGQVLPGSQNPPRGPHRDELVEALGGHAVVLVHVVQAAVVPEGAVHALHGVPQHGHHPHVRLHRPEQLRQGHLAVRLAPAAGRHTGGLGSNVWGLGLRS